MFESAKKEIGKSNEYKRKIEEEHKKVVDQETALIDKESNLRHSETKLESERVNVEATRNALLKEKQHCASLQQTLKLQSEKHSKQIQNDLDKVHKREEEVHAMFEKLEAEKHGIVHKKEQDLISFNAKTVDMDKTASQLIRSKADFDHKCKAKEESLIAIRAHLTEIETQNHDSFANKQQQFLDQQTSHNNLYDEKVDRLNSAKLDLDKKQVSGNEMKIHFTTYNLIN